jgi:hypothetical protein
MTILYLHEDKPQDIWKPDDLDHLFPAVDRLGPVRMAFPWQHIFEETAWWVIDSV